MPEPVASEVNPGLRALFDIPGEALADPPATDLAPAPPKPTVTPTEPEKPVVEEKPAPSDLTRRLAPDFAAAAEPASPAAVVDDHPEITEEMIAEEKNPKKQADMRRLGEMLNTYKRQVAELSAKAAATPVENPETKAMLESMTKERDEALSRLERTDLMASPKFQREHLLPRQKEFESAQRIVKDAGGDPEELKRAVALSGKARIDMLDEIRDKIPSDMMKGRFDRLIESVDNRTFDINERLGRAREENQQNQLDTKVQSQQQFEKAQQQMVALLGAARRDLAENHKLEVFQKVEGNKDFDWWNAQVDEIDAVAKEILLDSTPEKAAIAAHLAATAGPYRSMWQAERAARVALEKELSEYKGADPKMTAERKAVSSGESANGFETQDILGRLQSGAYSKR